MYANIENMKKYFILPLIIGVLLTSCDSAHFQDSVTPSSSSESTTMPTSEAPLGLVVDPFEINKIWDDSYADPVNGFTSASVISSASFIRNGSALTTFPDELRANADNKFEFYHHALPHMRYVDKSSGFALTFPLTNNRIDLDYSLAKYRLQASIGEAQVNISMESNTYSGDANGYRIYVTEWFDRYIHNPEYLKDNNLQYFHPTIYRSQEVLEGHVVSIWRIYINDSNQIAKPYYHIVIVRQLGQYQKFLLINAKSSKDESPLINQLIASYKSVTPRGMSQNYMESASSNFNPSWNEETKNYYQKLLRKEKVEFGMFTKSMPNDTAPSLSTIDTQLQQNLDRLQSAENGLGYTWDIMPTYTHIGWYNEDHHFPSILAEKYAGGNGFNNRPVLQFTYQFTTNNNAVSPSNTTNLQTPMFDILRGKYDAQFIRLARDIKAYQQPVLFRLNNEMNTDWTSYCGMMTLGDPEIFNLTWRYLYDIFEQENVDNSIWIWNPSHVSIPYSNWGEDLTYYPGHDYVHILGLTHYEMNNGTGNIPSFRTMYQDVYHKNNDLFGTIPWIISEFDSRSGGNANGQQLYRNQASQAQWVKDMLFEWKNRAINPYVKNIVGAVWFNCHDYAGDLIVNALAIDPPLTDTIKAFKEGFDALESLTS